MLVISYYVYVNLVDESTCFNADRLWCSLPIYNGVLVDRHLNLVAFVGTITEIWSLPFFEKCTPKCTLFLPFPHNRVKVSVHSTDLCDLRANFQIF